MRAALSVFCLALALSVSAAFAGPGDSQCPGDINGDSIVDVQDLLLVLAEWGCLGCPSDINQDGVTDVLDLLEVLADWGCEVSGGPVTPLSGVVTNLWTGVPIEGAEVTVGSDVLVTNQAGAYNGEFPPGQYTLTFEADNFNAFETSIILFPDLPATVDVSRARRGGGRERGDRRRR